MIPRKLVSPFEETLYFIPLFFRDAKNKSDVFSIFIAPYP